MNRVLIIGSATIDLVRQPHSSATKMGGVVTYGGLTFRKQGISTAVLTNLSARDASSFRTLYRGCGIDLDAGPSNATTTFVDHVEGDTRWQELLAVAVPITATQVVAATVGADHIHLGPLHPTDIHYNALTLLTGLGIPVSLDVQGYLRSPHLGRVEVMVSEHLPLALSASTYVKASRDELVTILNAGYLNDERFMHTFGIDELLITAGGRGGEILLASGERVRYDAALPAQVMDPTGAGDVFFAAYLGARLHDGRTVLDSCAIAATIAGQHVAGLYLTESCLALPESSL